MIYKFRIITHSTFTCSTHFRPTCVRLQSYGSIIIILLRTRMERIPEIKKLPSQLSHITKEQHWVKLIQAVMNQYRSRENFNPEILAKLRSDLNLSEEVFNIIYTGLYCLVVQIVRNHVRNPSKESLSSLEEELAPLNLPQRYVHILQSACTK